MLSIETKTRKTRELPLGVKSFEMHAFQPEMRTFHLKCTKITDSNLKNKLTLTYQANVRIQLMNGLEGSQLINGLARMK